MSQATLKQVDDLGKLKSFRIEDISLMVGPDAVVTLTLSHPAAEKQLRLKINSGVSFGRSGNVMVLNSTLTFGTEDID